jgi:uncharacterized protein (TIGR03067 family)
VELHHRAGGYEERAGVVKVISFQALTIEGDRYILTVGEHVLKGTYKIDPEKTPKTIDIHYENLEIAQGRIIQGIYVLEGDTLKTCFAWSGFERPTKFESPVWGGRRLEIWKRVKP